MKWKSIPPGINSLIIESSLLSNRKWSAQFEPLMLPHLDAAHNLARWLMGNDADAADVVQDTYMRALKSFDKFRGGDAKAWILRIARNTAYTRLRQRRGEESATPYDETIHSSSLHASDAASIVGWVDREELQRAIAALPIEFRETLILREMEGLVYKEIAHIVQIPIGTVMSRLARARTLLRSRLLQQRESWPVRKQVHP